MQILEGFGTFGPLKRSCRVKGGRRRLNTWLKFVKTNLVRVREVSKKGALLVGLPY